VSTPVVFACNFFGGIALVEDAVCALHSGGAMLISKISVARAVATVERGQMRIVATREHRIGRHRAFQDFGSV
jgi:hypothetical protein